MRGRLTRENNDKLATGLGWFSIGLGVAEIVMPRSLARFIGVDHHPALMRLLGMREIAAGVGILTTSKPAGWLWSRVAGDAMDLALLAGALASPDSDRDRVAGAVAAVSGVTLLDVACARQQSREAPVSMPGQTSMSSTRGPVRASRSIIVGRPPEECYRFWRDLENLPKFMTNVESVRLKAENRSHWVVRGPAGRRIEWDADIVEDTPNRRIAWRSRPPSDIDHSGSVQFERAPGDRGTLIRVELRYSPPGGAAAAGLAKLLASDPSHQIAQDLRAFKQIMEVGEIVHSDASIHRRMHAAQPPEDPERVRRIREAEHSLVH